MRSGPIPYLHFQFPRSRWFLESHCRNYRTAYEVKDLETGYSDMNPARVLGDSIKLAPGKDDDSDFLFP